MSRLVEIIRREVEKAGVISFCRFMELALYCPVYGYYEKEKDTVGREGDFFTSVSVGAVFGQLLAFQFAEWSGAFPDTCRIIEAGAHRARLANDILAWLRARRPELLPKLEYWMVEPSRCNQRRQQEALAKFGGQVRWAAAFDELPEDGGRAGEIIFSNELLDAMPVHRLGWDSGKRRWFEWGVAFREGRFIWASMPPGNEICLPCLPDEMLDVLPHGFTTEVSPAAENWWRSAARRLRRGKLLAIDYGLTADERWAPHRERGTVRGYLRHHASSDLLASPGEQDLTADVNFTALQAAGEAAGLITETFVTQSKFLTRIAERLWNSPDGEARWSGDCIRQFQTLTHPEHLGQAFRVLVQSRPGACNS